MEINQPTVSEQNKWLQNMTTKKSKIDNNHDVSKEINGRSKGLVRVSLHTNVSLQTVKFNFQKQLPYTNRI